MPTIIDSLLVTMGLDPSGMKKGAAEAGKTQKKLEEDTKKSSKRMSDDDRKRAEEQKKQNKQATDQSRAIADGIRKVRNETIGMLALFTGGMGVKNFVANTVDQAASLKFLSENLDTSVESIQAYQRASERMGGTAAGAVAQMQESQRELSRLRTGQGPSEAMQATFRAAGMAGEAISQKDLSTGNAYLLARSRIVAVLYKQNAANAALMAQQMGISEEQFNLIKQGPAAIQALVDAQRRNSVISGQDAAKALELKNRWLDFTDSMAATGTKVLVSLIPAFKQVLGWLQSIADYIVAHRKDIADWINATVPKVLALAEAFGKFVKDMDWKGFIADAKVLLGIVTDLAKAAASVAEFMFPKEESKGEFEKGADKLLSQGFGVMKNLLKIVASSVTNFGPSASTSKTGVPAKPNSQLAAPWRSGADMRVGAGTVAQSNNSMSTSKTDVKIGQITVQTQATDAAGIAKSIGGALTRYGFVPQANTGMR